ncbi:MAG: CbtA family protein [Pseudomonadota bacterium]|nr:CbtA family protein [Pseudomonadota bacterium]
MAGTDGLAGRAPRNPFTRIVSTAVAAGLLAGLVLTAVQTVQIVPTILQAETYEDAAPAAAAPVAHAHEHAHESASEPAHEHAGWKPENGTERTSFTVLANVSMGVAYALLLCAALTVAGVRPTLRQGLMWGAAGYAVFFMAPSLGLPPELPGTSAAPLRERQLWWALTALSTAGGLALLAFGHGRVRALAGFVLLAAPQMIGAPQPLVHTSSAPPELQHAFVVASALANAAFWLAVGGFSSYFFKKFE